MSKRKLQELGALEADAEQRKTKIAKLEDEIKAEQKALDDNVASQKDLRIEIKTEQNKEHKIAQDKWLKALNVGTNVEGKCKEEVMLETSVREQILTGTVSEIKGFIGNDFDYEASYATHVSYKWTDSKGQVDDIYCGFTMPFSAESKNLEAEVDLCEFYCNSKSKHGFVKIMSSLDARFFVAVRIAQRVIEEGGVLCCQLDFNEA